MMLTCAFGEVEEAGRALVAEDARVVVLAWAL